MAKDLGLKFYDVPFFQEICEATAE